LAAQALSFECQNQLPNKHNVLTMKRNIIYLVDENPPARRANVEALRRLLDNQEIQVKELEPLTNMADYNRLVAEHTTAAFVLDQRMKQAGLVNYNGTDLAAHLRSIDSKMPIYILTGYAEEKGDFDGSEYLVEYIIGKGEMRDQNSKEAKIIKARMLRHLDVFNDVLDEREQRFHDLLIKSLSTQLTQTEQDEMNKIEGETTAPIQAAERLKEQELGKSVEQLRRLLDSGQLPLKA